MTATKHDILDLVVTTVKLMCHDTGSVPNVRLGGDNILIGDKPVSITDIEANTHSAKGFMKLIKEAI